MKTKKIYTWIAWIFPFLSLGQQGLAPIANQLDEISSLVKRPRVYQSIGGLETRSKKLDFFSGINREGGEFKAFHFVANSATTIGAGMIANSPSVVGAIIPPCADNFALVTFLPSENLWSLITQHDQENV